MPRILIAGLFHETHTFLDGSTGLSAFHIRRGDEMLACKGDASPLGGVLELAEEFGWEMLPAVDYRAQPSAIVEDEVLVRFWREMEQSIDAELAAGIDAVYLVLHGAMATQGFADVEGEILSSLREIPGLQSVPVFGVFDLHANFSQRMADHADCLIAYRKNPHTDAREAALIAARLLQRCLTSGEVPRQLWQHPPLMWPPTGTGTDDEPMKSLESMARQMEEEHADAIWAVNVVAGFSFADTPDTGVSFVVSTTGPDAEAQTLLQKLSDHALASREQGCVVDPPVREVVRQIDPPPPGLTVLVEPSDNIGGGAPGDGTGLLRALVDARIPNAAVCICDPAAVQRLQKAQIDEELWIPIGGKGSRLDSGPLSLRVQLVSRWGGLFELEDKQSHLASMTGNSFDMGACAIVKHAGLTILLTSVKTPPFDLGQWRSQGLEPTRFSVIGVKAAVAHRRAYDKIASRMLWVDTPGPCSSNLRSLPFQKVRRPIFPLDADA